MISFLLHCLVFFLYKTQFCIGCCRHLLKYITNKSHVLLENEKGLASPHTIFGIWSGNQRLERIFWEKCLWRTSVLLKLRLCNLQAPILPKTEVTLNLSEEAQESKAKAERFPHGLYKVALFEISENLLQDIFAIPFLRKLQVLNLYVESLYYVKENDYIWIPTAVPMQMLLSMTRCRCQDFQMADIFPFYDYWSRFRLSYVMKALKELAFFLFFTMSVDNITWYVRARRFCSTGDMTNGSPFIQGLLEWLFSELFCSDVSLWNQYK